MNNNFDNLSKNKFKLVERDDRIFDSSLQTKPIGYFQDAWIRFKRNKGSLVAACVIVFLLLFAIIVPIFSPYDVSFSDSNLAFVTPKLKIFEGSSFWGGTITSTTNERKYFHELAKGYESGRNSLVSTETYIDENGITSYKIKQDTYTSVGYVYFTLEYKDFIALQEYQLETGIQVIYPMVDWKVNSLGQRDANYWYKYTGSEEFSKAIPIWKDGVVGQYTPNYAMYSAGSLSRTRGEYYSLRIEGDPSYGKDNDPTGGYAYSLIVNTPTGTPLDKSMYQIRVCYYDYFIYKNGHEPSFVFGLNGTGRDIFTCLAYGARTSFLLAISVSLINLLIGAVIGALQGYYGGSFDLIMERITDVLNAIPFIVITVLFSLYLLEPIEAIPGLKGLGAILALIIAFVFTGWIGPAARVRVQFYRFKNMEYVMAARTLGAKDGRLMFRHIFPNAIGTIITSVILVIPGVIFTEATLSFLGIINLEGPNATSVGTMLEQGQAFLQTSPHIILFPAIFIALLMISFNLFGNGLRDAFNPSLRGAEG